MNERPTPETDAFFRSFADGDATPSHAEYYDRMTQLERERDEAREWKNMLSGWGGTPEIVHEFIKGQQARIHAAQDIERELEQAKQDAKQHEVDCLRALGERNEARAEVQRIQHWATVNGTIQMQREIDEARKQRDEAREDGLEQARLLGMSGSREAKLISERDEARAELEQVKQDAKQHEVDCLRALGERNEAREQRDESLRLLGKWGQVAIGAGERVLELTKQRDKLAEAARFVIEDSDLACGHFWPDVVKKCKEALAAVEGGKP